VVGVAKRLQSVLFRKPAIIEPFSDNTLKSFIKSAASLTDVWGFLRQHAGAEPVMMALSLLDEHERGIVVHTLDPDPQATVSPWVPVEDSRNHLATAFRRKDTTYCGNPQELGQDLLVQLPSPPKHLFSVPFICGNRTVALVTLGFQHLNVLTQQSVSRIYQLRDQLSPLLWSLTLEARVKTRSERDPLTGLLTLSAFQRALRANRSTRLSMLLLDVRHLEAVNENLGWAGGDAVLTLVSETLRQLRGPTDLLARLGDDEFAWLLDGADAQTAREAAEKVMNTLAQAEALDNVQVAMGAASLPTDTAKVNDLKAMAQKALKLAQLHTGETSTVRSWQDVTDSGEREVFDVFAARLAERQPPGRYQALMGRVEESTANVADTLMLETIGSLAGALDAKDRYTRGHSQAVANYAVALCQALQLSPEETEQVRLAAFLHDIGKIGVPEAILCKQGPLTEEEWAVMRQHPVIGARQILAPVTGLKEVIPMVEYHHENWDGSGYPYGLVGEAIPVGARIVSVVDAFHGLTSDRCYRKALPLSEVRRILNDGAGKQWDPDLIAKFLNILNAVGEKLR
jgi:diguanylate cyclase (GGDEF)-like protein/putative nucleotidyltransferase with HDIG domain